MEHVVSFVCWIETSRQVVSFHEFDQSQQSAASPSARTVPVSAQEYPDGTR